MYLCVTRNWVQVPLFANSSEYDASIKYISDAHTKTTFRAIHRLQLSELP